jgi:hypothetical protein
MWPLDLHRRYPRSLAWLLATTTVSLVIEIVRLFL